MRLRFGWLSCAFVTGGCLLVGSPAAEAGISYLSQQRQVVAVAGPESETISAADFGLFDAEATADASTGNVISTARTSMKSSLLQTGMTFTGTQAFEVTVTDQSTPVDLMLGADTQIGGQITFSIDEPYYFSYSRTTTVHEQSGSLDGGFSYQFLAGDGSFGYLNTIPATGRIEPGEYSFNFVDGSFNVVTGTTTPGTFEADYSISLGLQAVPLPPAVWAGLVTMAGVAVGGCIRKRRAVE